MRHQISRVLSLSGLTLGLMAWAIFLAGSLYAFVALSSECPPNGLFPPRESMQMMVSNFAWWFALVGLPLGLVAVGVNYRNHPGWVGAMVNATFWVLQWGWMYGDVATCQYR